MKSLISLPGQQELPSPMSLAPKVVPIPGWNGVQDAWAAGVFEGEGCLYKNGSAWRMRLNMTDLDVVERFAAWSQVGKVREDKSPSRMKTLEKGFKRVFVWETSGRYAYPLVKRLYGFMGERRRGKMDEFLKDAEGRKWFKDVVSVKEAFQM